eukprot:scaffold85101_cov23-Tisochrysis_lutea.AAC.2
MIHTVGMRTGKGAGCLGEAHSRDCALGPLTNGYAQPVALQAGCTASCKSCVAVLSLEQRKLAAQLAAGGGGNAGGLPNEESLLALEKRMAERQARIEGALMQ